MSKKILLIEDAEEYHIIVSQALKAFPHIQILKATDGAAGLEIAQRVKPDLILCDIALPTMDGFEILKEIHKSPNTSQIPLIFLTAYDDNAHMVKAVDMGAADYLSKPFTGEELVETLEQSVPTVLEDAA
jgi:DNA-binding response OmpR family regulator